MLVVNWEIWRVGTCCDFRDLEIGCFCDLEDLDSRVLIVTFEIWRVGCLLCDSEDPVSGCFML